MTQLVHALKARFPWLGTEEPAEGADTIQQLSEFYAELSRTVDGPEGPMALNAQETATVLHGLRMIQCGGRIEGCNAGDCEHFDDDGPLNDEEIDELCERLNCFDVAALPPGARGPQIVVTPQPGSTLIVWKLISDTDNGTDATVYTDKHEAYTRYFESVFPSHADDPDGAAARALEDRNYARLEELGGKHLEDTSVDTIYVQAQTIVIPAAQPRETSKRVKEGVGENQGDAQALLDRAAEAQTAYWDALSDLESAVGFDVDGAQELAGRTVDELVHEGDEDDDE